MISCFGCPEPRFDVVAYMELFAIVSPVLEQIQKTGLFNEFDIALGTNNTIAQDFFYD
jgi:hypothetical protein